MAWSNMEVQSVEIVQDMSYEVLLNKMQEEYDKSGISGVYEAMLYDFRIAIQKVESIGGEFININDMLLQCEESLNILIGAFFASIAVSPEKSNNEFIFIRIEEICQRGKLNRITEVMVKECEGAMKRTIKILDLVDAYRISTNRSVTYLEGYLTINKGESLFKLFADNILYFSSIVNNKISSSYGSSNKELIDDAICAVMAYNAHVLNGDKKYSLMKPIEKIAEQAADKIWYSNRKSVIEHPFISAVSKL